LLLVKKKKLFVGTNPKGWMVKGVFAIQFLLMLKTPMRVASIQVSCFYITDLLLIWFCLELGAKPPNMYLNKHNDALKNGMWWFPPKCSCRQNDHRPHVG
jgi:hypothetical protein